MVTLADFERGNGLASAPLVGSALNWQGQPYAQSQLRLASRRT